MSKPLRILPRAAAYTSRCASSVRYLPLRLTLQT